MPEVSSAFVFLSHAPVDIPPDKFSLLQAFLARMYKLASKDVDQARLERLFYEARDFCNLPPGSDALYQHILQAAYQGRYIWGKTLTPNPILPCPSS